MAREEEVEADGGSGGSPSRDLQVLGLVEEFQEEARQQDRGSELRVRTIARGERLGFF